MPENPSPNQGWKNKANGPAKKENTSWKQQPAAKADIPSGTRGWQDKTATPAGLPGPTSWGTRLAVAVGLFSLLVVGVVAAILLLRPLRPACLVLLGASYDVNLALPHNVYGWHGLRDLAEHADKTGFVDSLFSAPSQTRLAYPAAEPGEIQGKKSWDKIWGDMPKVFSQKTVIIFLAMHGGADREGAYLFLGDKQGQEKIYLKTILEALPDKVPGKNIILVLEPAQMGAHWPSGMLQNQFVQKLKELTPDIEKQPGLLVLCASDDDQISWPSEEWRRTIFAHYLIEGLQGAADQRKFGGNADSRVTAAELFGYVKARVSAWAQSTRGAPQTPILLGGDQRAQDIELVQIAEAYVEKGPQGAPGRKATSNELEEAWKSCATLGGQVPAPEVYTPHLWRWYRDALLRWEQLERAAASPGRIAILKDKCAILARDIKNQSKPRADLTSWEITRALPLPGVLGAAPASASERDALIKEFWSLMWRAKNDVERRQVLNNLRARAKVGEELASEPAMAFYGQLCRQLLATISPDDFKAEDLKVGSPLKARVRFLEKEFDLGKKRPAEINYLMALLNDLDPLAPPPAKDLKTALDVRTLAEEAGMAAPASLSGNHFYSEVVCTWISPRIKVADDQRRRGEDSLFGGDKEWKKARELLAAAKTGYQEALDDAAVIREALALRDGALADLPYYADWLARRPLPPGTEPAEKLEMLVSQVERLSEHVGQLTWALKAFPGQDFRKPHPERNPKGLTRKELMVQWIRELKNDFQDPKTDLADKFKSTCRQLESAEEQPLVWQDLEAALATPLIDQELRKAMLAKSHTLSRKFLDEFHELKPKIFREEKPEEAADRQRRQERLARAVLVPKWQDNHPLDIAVANDKKAAAELAREIGASWQKLAGQIAEKYSASCQSIDLGEAIEQLRDADFRCRLLPGGTVAWLAPPWKSELPYGPPQGLRNLRLHDLLLDQARRARDDYWFTETREPYYAPAARAYARMAQDLAVADNLEIINKDTINAARKKKAKELADVADVRLTAQPPANPNWTSEPQFELTWKVGAAGNIPKGIPVYWLKLQEGALKAAQNPELFQRQAATSWPPEEKYSLASPSEKERNDSDQKSREATFVCVYRGQQITSPQEVRFCNPDTIVRHFPPDKAGLAFRLDKGFDYGAISIVLDCSGSMNTRMGKLTRFQHAANALDEALETIPDDTFLSLLVFVTLEDGGDPKFQFLQEPAKWKQADRADLIRKVRRLKIYQGASPIARALVESRDRGFPTLDRYDGPKLIVGLTDGDDNWSFRIDPATIGQNTYNLKVADYLRKQFYGRKTEIQIVCFNDGKNAANIAEIGRATEQFKKTIEDDLDPPGTFRVQPDPAKLADDLKNAARPKLHLQTAFKAVAGFPKEGKPVNPYRGNTLDWLRELDPVQYTAWVQNRKDQNIPARNILLHSGDFMIVGLKRDRKTRDIIFERSLYANEVLAPRTTKGSLLIAALQNQIDKESTLQQLLSVEHKMTDNADQPLLIEQQPLGFFWLETKPKSAMSSGPVSWRRDYGYPAPAFRLKIQDWPFEAGEWALAETTLWWAVNKYPESALLVEPKTVGSLKDRFTTGEPLQVGNARIRIEDVRIENHEVETVSREKVRKDCLVVRVSHEAKKPVFVLLQPNGDVPYHAEQRFYAEAQKVTALFDLPGDPQLAQFSLRLISLDDFKAECKTANRWARFESLDRMDQAAPQRVGLPGTP